MTPAGHAQVGRDLFYRIPVAGDVNGYRTPLPPLKVTIPAWSIDPGPAHALMRAAEAADQPGSGGIYGAAGVDDRDNEWTLISVCIHEAAHAVVAERYGAAVTSILIERDARLGWAWCVVPSIADMPAQVQRQIGMAGLIGELQARHGSYLSLDLAVEAFRRGPLSRSDFRLMQGTASSSEIDVCMRRVHLQWGDVSSRARNLMSKELQHYCGMQR